MPESAKSRSKPKKQPAPARPVAPQPSPKPLQEQPAPPPSKLPVIYPVLEIDEYSSTSVKGPMDAEWWVDVLGWETEKQFQKRKMEQYPGTVASKWSFGENGVQRDDTGEMQPIHCTNMAGEKVVCWHNAHNRPFDKDWSLAIVEMILEGQWAGPFTLPGETVNGETVRISRHGEVLSGQHQGTATILAQEKLDALRASGADHAGEPKYPVWRTHSKVFIEGVVIKGVSSDPRVMMTVDYVKPRTAADVFYTSEVFRDSVPVERRDLCRTLASATDFLWTRTDAKGYRTHPEVCAFLERHKRLLKCVAYLHSLNAPSAVGGRKISKLRLQPGMCAALAYLMAASGTSGEDSDVYRNMEPAPSEKGIDFSLWDRAEEFWDQLADAREVLPLVQALGDLMKTVPSSEDNQGLGGRAEEKLALLAAGWERYKEHPSNAGPPFDDADREDGGILHLTYTDLDASGKKMPDGKIALIEQADFYGIDCPPKDEREARDPPPPTGGDIEAMKAAAQARWSDAERAKRKVGG